MTSKLETNPHWMSSPTRRPLVMGSQAVVSSGHYLATEVGMRVLRSGGNAIDAGVAAGIGINVLMPHLTSFAGVAPIITYDAKSNKSEAISGLGVWPRKATIDYHRTKLKGDIPRGVFCTVTPAACDAWLTAIERSGRLSFEEVVAPALELCERGFPMYQGLQRFLQTRMNTLKEWPSTFATLYPGGKAPPVGALFKQPDLARTFRRMIEAERSAKKKGREAGIRAARDLFYKGDIAREIAAFYRREGGLLTEEDLATYCARVEQPVEVGYKDYRVLACGPWCQGPAVPQALKLLEGLDLRGMGHNSTDYIHTVVEAFKLVFADRHRYYGDPEFVDVPMKGLLSDAYAARRRRQLDPRRAAPAMPAWGDPWAEEGRAKPANQRDPQPALAGEGAVSPDTSYVCAVDGEGNAFSATPSDNVWFTPIVPGLGLAISGRGRQSWLDPDHASSLAPGKRPRLTPNPAMAFYKGKLFMPFGTPGGDVQCQTMVQGFLNVVEFGMDPQQAVEAPRFATWSFPNSFWPHTYLPGRLAIEARVDESVRDELARRGHQVETWAELDPRVGSMCMVQVDQASGARLGAADPRSVAYAMGW